MQNTFVQYTCETATSFFRSQVSKFNSLPTLSKCCSLVWACERTQDNEKRDSGSQLSVSIYFSCKCVRRFERHALSRRETTPSRWCSEQHCCAQEMHMISINTNLTAARCAYASTVSRGLVHFQTMCLRLEPCGASVPVAAFKYLSHVLACLYPRERGAIALAAIKTCAAAGRRRSFSAQTS